MGRFPFWVLFGLTLFAVSFNDVLASGEDVGPSESECRPYIEKAINELKTGEPNENDDVASPETTSGEDTTNTEPDQDDDNDLKDQNQQSQHDQQADDEDDDGKEDKNSSEAGNDVETVEITDANSVEEATAASADDDTDDDQKSDEQETTQSAEEQAESGEKSQEDGNADDTDDDDKNVDNGEGNSDDENSGEVTAEDNAESTEDDGIDSKETAKTSEEVKDDDDGKSGEETEGSTEEDGTAQAGESSEDEDEVVKRSKRSVDAEPASGEDKEDTDDDDDDDGKDSKEKSSDDDDDDVVSKEDVADANPEDDDDSKENEGKTDDENGDSKEIDAGNSAAADDEGDGGEDSKEAGKSGEDDNDDENDNKDGDSKETDAEKSGEADADADDDDDDKEDKEDSEEDTKPEDELLWEGEIPENLRNRNHITELLQLDDEFEAKEKAVDRVAEIVLRDIKRIHENGIKPLESMYKYRDLSNRHFSDPEIFSKPLILFMGPWSGGKSSIINYLTGNEYTPHSLRTGAEPSPAYFNILMWGNETEVLDGTQLAADYTFAGLQKFGQGLEDRLRGLKLPSKLLEKVNIVEIPGILEVRKQVSRLFPFNDACQWFIDRADIIFLVYDPAKLDVGPETEAILDQLKGREYQTRIILNKADTVKPEELLRVQSALIWNISPLMSSAQPPLVYTTSLWSHPYENGSPARLLQAQERAFLRDMRTAIDKRIEHKISSARRFAVRVRNHAKMVDCYLNTYHNHKTLFGNKKRIADNIIENPQNYHIYEGLSTLTNISRYDLPDPDVYRDFFRLNPLYEFKKLSETCTYFRGCPISKLDVAIAYDLPELAGKYKKMAEAALSSIDAKLSADNQRAQQNKS